MQAQSAPLFHLRPMFALAAGLCAGILLSKALNGTRLYFAVCLFALFFAAALLWRMPFQYLFAIAAAVGLLRAEFFGAFSLSPALMAPFAYARMRLLEVTDLLFGSEAPVFAAMLWGDKSDIPKAVTNAFRASGTAHILALSGLHVSFVAGVIDRLTAKCSRRRKFYIAAMALFCYCAIAAFPSSLVRATVMTLTALYAGFCGRRYDIASGLSFAALVILLCDPSQLYEIGFQLSFAAVAAIAMLMPLLKKPLSFLPSDISSLLSVSVCGTLGTLPLGVYHFGKAPLLSLFANLLILPVIPMAFVLALLCCLLGLVIPPAAQVMAIAPTFLMRAATAAAECVSALPFAVREGSISALACALVYLAYFCISDYPLVKRRTKFAACAVMFAAALCCMV